VSTKLPSIDLTGAIVGSKYMLDFRPFIKFNSRNFSSKAHIRVFNESGVGVQYTMIASGDSDNIPAGGWGVIEVEPNDSQMNIVVQYTLPNPPVSIFNATYFDPGEVVPPVYTLGNSPIGIGGTVNTSNVQTLSQEGQAKTLLTIDIGDSVLSQLIKINNDGTATWNVDVAGVAHAIFAISATANFLKIGQAIDNVEFLCDTTMPNSTGIFFKDHTGTATNRTIGIDVSDIINFIASVANKFQWKDNVGNVKLLLDVAAAILTMTGAVAINPTVVSTSGSVSGTCSMYQVLTGTFKFIIMNWVNFRTANTVSLAIPVPFTSSVDCITFGIAGGAGDGGLGLLVGSTLQSTQIINSLSAAGGGSAGAVQNVLQYSLAQSNTAVDHINVLLNTAAHTGMALLWGV